MWGGLALEGGGDFLGPSLSRDLTVLSGTYRDSRAFLGASDQRHVGFLGFDALESPRLNLERKFGVWCFWTQMPLASPIWISGASFAS